VLKVLNPLRSLKIKESVHLSAYLLPSEYNFKPCNDGIAKTYEQLCAEGILQHVADEMLLMENFHLRLVSIRTVSFSFFR